MTNNVGRNLSIAIVDEDKGVDVVRPNVLFPVLDLNCRICSIIRPVNHKNG